jgi:predicted enzyme related to lactoylglutathione lyase
LDTPLQPPPDVQLGDISWHELATTDRAAAFSFYQQLFGWHETGSMDMGPQGIYQLLAPAGGAGRVRRDVQHNP